MVKFFTDNPDFDLKTGKIKEALENADITEVSNKERTTDELKRINRLYKIHPDYDFVVTLRKEGVDSVMKLVKKYTPEQFSNKMKEIVGTEIAATIYKKTLSISKHTVGNGSRM